ncbi:MAG: type II toxin-antitoxin system VapC family toxin [SAR324 cluster bacterium]|nr:type II toxin-antitoxin system VapC family toxin [SAR324 cluster bacterium]
MRFWDSSAIVPLLVEEPQTGYCLEILKNDEAMLIWCLSRVEIISALCRKKRDATLSHTQFRQAKLLLTEIVDRAHEVTSFERVRARAVRLLENHPLRAADACQLAAALVATQEIPERLEIICFDERLTLAAEKEGFLTNPGNIMPAHRP